MNLPCPRRLLLAILAPSLLALATVVPAAAASAVDGGAGTQVRLRDARDELSRLGELLRNRQAVNADIVAAIDAVKAAYDHLAPDLVKDKATGAEVEDTAAFEAAKKTFPSDAEKEYYKALGLLKVVGASETNERDDVNVRAAQVLAAVRVDARERVVKELSKFMETTVPERQKTCKVPTSVYDAVFGALASIADKGNGGLAYFKTWIRYDNTGDVPARIRSAFDAMARLKGVPGDDRHDFVEQTVILFGPVENLAEHFKPGGPKKQSNPKAVWDPLKPSVVRMLQVFCGEPKEKDGGLIASVAGFEVWLRAHKDVRKEPWAP